MEQRQTQASTPKAVQDCHALLLWMLPHLDKLPKNRRYTLGEKLENRILTILESLVTAAYAPNKRTFLFQANRDLEVDVLGYRVFPGFRQLRNDNGHRFARKLRGFARGYARHELDWDDFNPSVCSWIGHACHANTLGLRRRIFGATVFRREKG